MASVMFRAFPGGTMMVSVATALGISIPPPTPVSARTATKESYVGQKALAMENRMIMAPPRKISLWCPYMAPSRPLMRTKALCVSLNIPKKAVSLSDRR